MRLRSKLGVLSESDEFDELESTPMGLLLDCDTYHYDQHPF